MITTRQALDAKSQNQRDVPWPISQTPVKQYRLCVLILQSAPRTLVRLLGAATVEHKSRTYHDVLTLNTATVAVVH